jgi:predicted Ser/Thr protein kinase
LHEAYEALNTQLRTSSEIIHTQKSIVNTEPSNKYYIPFDEIEIQKELGKGSYGRVCLGLWNGAQVALKFCKEKERIKEFWKEVNLLMFTKQLPREFILRKR